MSTLPILITAALTLAPAPTPPNLPADAPAGDAPTSSLGSVLIRTAEGEREVSLQDESTWEGLTPRQRDVLRAERARRLAPPPPEPEPEPDPEPVAASVPSPRLYLSPGYDDGRRDRLRVEFDARERRLIGSTAAFGIMFGVFTLTTVGLLAARVRSPGPYMLTGLGSSVTSVGTIVSGTLLGAHRNARKLYYAASPGGLTLRF